MIVVWPLVWALPPAAAPSHATAARRWCAALRTSMFPSLGGPPDALGLGRLSLAVHSSAVRGLAGAGGPPVRAAVHDRRAAVLALLSRQRLCRQPPAIGV